MRKVWYSIIAMVLLAGTGFVFYTQNSEAQSLWRSGGEVEAELTPPPAVTEPERVIVDAVVVPVREANLSMAASGIVAQVLTGDGATVSAGDPLLRLESTRQQAAVAQAQANLRSAQAKLAELQAPPRPEEIARYQSSVTSAQAQLQDVMDGATSSELAAAQADLANAEAELRKAQSDYDEVAWRTDIGMLPQATALERATNNYVAAQARYDDIADGASQAQVTGASAQVSAAQSELDLLMAGVQAETIAGAEASVAAAEATLLDAQAALEQTTLYAPFDGTIGSINVEVGEQVSPGMAVVQLANLTAWRIETEDLTELSVVQVQRGDHVEISIDALPELELTGRVVSIKPVGESKQGDITYTALIELDEQDQRLYWNMTAQATITEDAAGRAAMRNSAPQTVADFMLSETQRQDAASTQLTTATTNATTDTTTDATGAATVSAGVQNAEATESTGASIMVTVQTAGANLNVRSGPGTGYDIIAKVRPGDTFPARALDDSGSWVQIEWAEGQSGWVSTGYVEFDGDRNALLVSPEKGEPPTETIDSTTVDDSTANDATEMQPVSQGPAAPIPAAEDGASATAVPAQDGDGWSGTLVFQASSGGIIYAYELASGTLWPLTNGMDPALSPDGRTVAFVRGGGANGLYLIGIDGSNERQIYGGGEGLRTPAWSPDGQQIVFSRVIGESTCRSVATSVCVEDNAFLDGFPLQSSDLRGLSQIDANGENFRDIATLNTATSPDWSAAGVVYASSAGLQIIEDVQGDDNRVIAAEFNYADPDWQPGGGRIVYQSQEGNHRELMTIHPDGSGEMFLTRPTNLLAKEYPQNVAPVWSPDGQHIAFLSNRTESGEAGDWAIWIMDANGGSLQKLPIDVAFEYNFQNEQVLDWS